MGASKEGVHVTPTRIRTYSRVLTNALVCLAMLTVLVHFAREYIRLGEYAMSGPGVVPMWSDEAVYHLNAKYFVTSHGYGDSTIIEELESKLGHFGPHGPAYNIIDGATYALFGDSFNVKIFSNVAILIACVLIVLSTSSLSISRRLALTLVPVTSFVSVNYLFSYMQEIVQIGIACVLWRVTWSLSRQPLTTGKLVSALPMLLLACAARSGWVFATPVFAGLRHTNRRSATLSVLLGLVTIAITLVAFPLFNASYPTGVLYSIRQHIANHDYAQILHVVSHNLTRNLDNFFAPPPSEALPYFANRLLYIAAWVLLTCIGLLKRSRFALMGSLFGAFYFLALVGVYDTFSWKEHRALAGPLVFMGLTIVAEVSLLTSLPFIVTSVLIGSSAFDTYAHQFVTVKRQHAELLKTQGVPDFVQELRSTIRGGSTETVLLSITMLIHDTKPFLMLPTVSDDNTPIRYTLNLVDASWKRHGRIPIRYAVLRPLEAEAAGLPADTSSNAYRLFQFPDR